jgi:hypothetical protein
MCRHRLLRLRVMGLLVCRARIVLMAAISAALLGLSVFVLVVGKRRRPS